MDDFNNNKLSFEGTGGDEEEFIMLSLRLKSGLNYSEFEKKFGYTLPSYIIKKLKSMKNTAIQMLQTSQSDLHRKVFLFQIQ